jgi:hypothetical protein
MRVIILNRRAFKEIRSNEICIVNNKNTQIAAFVFFTDNKSAFQNNAHKLNMIFTIVN